MEIKAWKFFSFWAYTGAVSLFLGIEALDKTDLPNSVSPVVLSLFKISLAISACHSSGRALVFRPKLKISVGEYCTWLSLAAFSVIVVKNVALYLLIHWAILAFAILSLDWKSVKGEFVYKVRGVLLLFSVVFFLSRRESMGWYIAAYTYHLVLPFIINTMAAECEEQNGLSVHLATVSFLSLVPSWKIIFFPVLVILFATLTSFAQAAISGDERFHGWLPENQILSKLMDFMEKINREEIQYAIGMGCTVLFQYFFRLSSFEHVIPFLYLEVAWLANLFLLLSPHDFGVFNFLLGNVIVGCTVSQFGLGGTTWLIYCGSILLYILRLKISALVLVNRGEDNPNVIAWRD